MNIKELGTKSKKYLTITIVLGLVVLAITIFSYSGPSEPVRPLEQPSPGESTTPPIISEDQVSLPPTLPKNLTGDELELLQLLGDIPPQAEQRRLELARKLAKEASLLELSGCVGNPLVLKVKKGQNFTITNKNAEEITFFFAEKGYLISAGGSEEILLGELGKGTGLSGYICAGSAGNIPGFVLVTE